MRKAPLSDEQARRWERNRGVLGFIRFILLVGALRWGVVTALLYSGFWWSFSFGDESFIQTLSRALVIFPIAGVTLFGPLMWTVGDANYQSWCQAKRQAESRGG